MDLNIGGGAKSSHSKGLQDLGSLAAKQLCSLEGTAFPSTNGRGLKINLSKAKVRFSGEGSDLSDSDKSLVSTVEKTAGLPRSQGYLLPRNDMGKKVAFTLAEVLITLGIIGVVAALTLPQLIRGYQKSVVETRLSHFYSVINQAIKMATVEYGEPEGWGIGTPTVMSGACEYNTEVFNKYIKPYIKLEESDCLDETHRGAIFARLENGSAFTFNVDINGGDIMFLPDGNKDIVLNENEQRTNKNAFAFQFLKREGEINRAITNKQTVEPYTYRWDGTIEQLKRGDRYSCYDGGGNFCAKLIQLNGWKIPKDYPW